MSDPLKTQLRKYATALEERQRAARAAAERERRSVEQPNQNSQPAAPPTLDPWPGLDDVERLEDNMWTRFKRPLVSVALGFAVAAPVAIGLFLILSSSNTEPAERAGSGSQPATEPAARSGESAAAPGEAVEVGTITTVAGTGEFDYSGDGGPAIEAGMHPSWLAFDAAGDLLFTDFQAQNNRVRRIDSAGIVTLIAGNGESGVYSGDGGLATETTFDPGGLAIGPDGSLYVAAPPNARVLRIDDRDEAIATVAGTGEEEGDGGSGPATDVPLAAPLHLAFDATGNLFIVEASSPRIRKVDADGVLTTIAGTGEPGYSGDGGPAIDAQIGEDIRGIAVDADGNVYFSENNGRRVRKVDTEGTITTVAGTGELDFSGDGGPATEATLAGPDGLAFAADGSLYIADRENNRVRRIDSDGIIDTVAGTGVSGYAGDGGPASEAELANPEGIAFDADGNLYIADFGNRRIRKVTLN